MKILELMKKRFSILFLITIILLGTGFNEFNSVSYTAYLFISRASLSYNSSTHLKEDLSTPDDANLLKKLSETSGYSERFERKDKGTTFLFLSACIPSYFELPYYSTYSSIISFLYNIKGNFIIKYIHNQDGKK